MAEDQIIELKDLEEGNNNARNDGVANNHGVANDDVVANNDAKNDASFLRHFIPIKLLKVKLPTTGFQKFWRALKSFLDIGDIAEPALSPTVKKAFDTCVAEREVPMKLWFSVYEMAKTSLFYAGSAITAYTFFSITVNTYQQTQRSSKVVAERIVQFGTASVCKIGGGAAISLLFFNYHALMAATRASRRYRTVKMVDLDVALWRVGFAERKKLLAKAKMSFFMRNWFYFLTCFVCLGASMVCSIWQLSIVCNLLVTENDKK